jgi:hypothetical protein
MIGWLWTTPIRHPGRTILLIGALFAAAYGASLVWLAKPDGRVVFGDALHQYVQLRSAVFDRDLRFTNEYLRLYGLTPAEIVPDTEWMIAANETGHVRNLMPVGPALLWAPAFLVTTAGVWLANAAGASYPFDGYGRVFQASAGFSGICAAAFGAWFAYLAARALFGRASAVWATLVVWLASSAVYYSVISPTYSHAASMFAVSLFCFVWIRTRDNTSVGRYALLGALAGLAALMRWQDAVLMAVVGIELIADARRVGWQGLIVRGAAAVAGAALAFSPQMFVWQRLYGHPLTIPQGAGFMQWTRPALGAVLFSDNHGLFSWTPIVAVAVAGLVPLARRFPVVGAGAIAFVIISWYVNAAAADWWAGEAFGARRFVACFPLFVLGTAALLDRWASQPRRILAGAVVMVGLTFLLLVQYQAFMHGARDIAPYPRGVYGLWIARFKVPVDLAAAWLRHS